MFVLALSFLAQQMYNAQQRANVKEIGEEIKTSAVGNGETKRKHRSCMFTYRRFNCLYVTCLLSVLSFAVVYC
jgi:hypothetical protein